MAELITPEVNYYEASKDGELKKMNLNSLAKVKLTEVGLNILKNNESAEYLLSKVDEEGYFIYELWEIMYIFGEHMYKEGIHINPPFELDIQVPEKYLGEERDLGQQPKNLNLDAKVRVKLTEDGINVLQNKDSFLLSYVDSDGYFRKEFWEIMNLFGRNMSVGNAKKPLEMDFLVPEKDLVDVQDLEQNRGR